MIVNNWHEGCLVSLCARTTNVVLVHDCFRQNKAAGEKQQVVPADHGDGGGRAADDDDGHLLSVEQADSFLSHSERLHSLQQARIALRGLGGALGASMVNTVERVMSSEIERFRQRSRGNALVDKEMRTLLESEEANYRKQREEFREHMQQVQEKKRVQKELRDAQEQLKKARKENRDALAVVTAKEATKTFTLESLGKDKKKAGGQQCQKLRWEVLERVRLVAELSRAQRTEWDYFKTEWDRAMAEIHGEQWAQLFAEYIQNVLNDLEEGSQNALSDFMDRETQRVLTPIPVLQIRCSSSAVNHGKWS